MQELYIRSVQRWKPCHIGCISSKDLLVKMISNDGINSEDVRWNREASFQFDINDIPLYASVHSGKCVFKNNNLDVWVSDAGSRTVIVRSLKVPHIWIFSLFGNSFLPNGITTDSYIRIMSVGYKNGYTCIHIVDVDGRIILHVYVKILLTAICMNHTVCAYADPIMTCFWLRRVATETNQVR